MSASPADGDVTDRRGATISLRLPAREARALADLAWERRTTTSALARAAVRHAYPSIVSRQGAVAG